MSAEAICATPADIEDFFSIVSASLVATMVAGFFVFRWLRATAHFGGILGARRRMTYLQQQTLDDLVESRAIELDYYDALIANHIADSDRENANPRGNVEL